MTGGQFWITAALILGACAIAYFVGVNDGIQSAERRLALTRRES